MGCGASKGSVEICNSQRGTVPLSRCFSYHRQLGSPHVENGYDDRLLIQNYRQLHLMDEEELSDISMDLSIDVSTNLVNRSVWSLFHTEDLELGRQEGSGLLNDELFVYDDAIVPINKAQVKHWRIEGRRPPSSASSRINSTDEKNSSQSVFAFTDFNIHVDEVELNVDKPVNDEVGQTTSFDGSTESVLRGATKTLTYKRRSWNNVNQFPKKKLKQALNCCQLKRFTVQNFVGHSARVRCISVLPDRHSFVSCSAEDASVVLQSLHNGTGEGIFTGHEDLVLCTAVSPGGGYLATASKDMTIKLWETIIPKLVCSFPHNKMVICCCFSHDSRIVASGCQDRICRLWDVRHANLLLMYKRHGGIIVSLAFSPNGSHVCSTSTDKELHVWSAKTGENHFILKDHTGFVLSCSYTSNGKYIVSNDSTYLFVWGANDGTCKLRLSVNDVCQGSSELGLSKNLTWTASCAAPGSFMQYAVAACSNRFVYLFDIFSGEQLSYVFCKAPVSCLTSGAPNKIVFGDTFGNIYVQSLF